MKRRSKRINYAEVESDEDLDDQQKQLERIKRDNGKKNGGDTYGTTQGGQRKKRKTTRNLKQLGGAGGEPEYNSKLLLDLPFDLFVEVCSHFDGQDLLKLAQVNRAIRGVLLSKEAHSVWSALRRKLGYALPNGMEEVEFALMVHSEKCQVCERRVGDEKPNAFLRTRLCYKCLQTYTISSKGLKKAWHDLHHFARDCVRYVDQGNRWGIGSDEPRPYRYLISDLQAVDHELKELEEEDEIAVSLLENLRSKGSSTRTRRSNEVMEEVDVARVESYVEEKQEWVKGEQEASQKHCKNLARLEKEEQDEARACREAVRESQVATAQMLKEHYEWKDDEADYLLRWGKFEKLAPKAPIEEKPEAWSKCRQLIRARIDEKAACRAQNQAHSRRQAPIRPYYEDLKRLKGNQQDVFPHFVVFLEFRSIRPLWEPEDATVDDEIWQALDSDISEDLNEYDEKSRVEAIRYILAANQGLSSTSSLSDVPSDYPETIYNENFFSKTTSLFINSNHYSYPRISVNPYPQTVRYGFYRDTHHLKDRIGPRQILIIRSLATAAGLDPDTATRDDLDRLGWDFVWVNDPRKSLRQSKRSWLDLLSNALRKGPTDRKIAQGQIFDFKYRPGDQDQDQDSHTLNSEEEDKEEENEGEEGSGDEGGESGDEEEENGSEDGNSSDENSDGED